MDETKEYLAIMAGHKRLELEYKAGDIVSGYTASGLHARIIESLHCGQYIEGWGFLVDREFEDGDIDKMKRHYYEWKEIMETQQILALEEERRQEEEREELLSGVEWTQKEDFQMDGSLSYVHHIKIDHREFILKETRISGIGRVILPEYEIQKDSFGDPLPEFLDGKWYWACIMAGREQRILMEPEEERAYRIVLQYGALKRT